MNYYRRYVGDFQRDTGHLCLAEVGAYDRLLDHYYATGEALPGALDVLCRICRAVSEEEKQAVESVAQQYFPMGKDRKRHNKRADKEIAVNNTARENGKGGGRPRKTGNETGSETGTITGNETTDGGQDVTGSVHPPTNQPPTNQPPPTNRHPSTANHQKNHSDRPASVPPTKAVWRAYSIAYEDRYHVTPVRNSKVNGQFASFLARLPTTEAPAVAQFYVRHNRGLYVTAKHPVDLLLRDAEGLRTEWKTGHGVTETEGRQADRTQATSNVFGPLIEEARERERIANGGK